MNWINRLLAGFKIRDITNNGIITLPTEHILDISKVAPAVKENLTHPLDDIDVFFDGDTPYGLMSMLSTMKYVGAESTHVKFFKRDSPIWKSNFNYNSIVVLAKTSDNKVFCTPFIESTVNIDDYDDICDAITSYKPNALRGDADVLRWGVIYLNTVTSEYDMRLSCLYE